MNTTASLIRIFILFSLGLIAFLLIFEEEQDETTLAFCLHVLFDKSIGVLCVLTFDRLYKRWSLTDKWIAKYEAWNTKGLEK